MTPWAKTGDRSVSHLLLQNNQRRNGFCLQMKGEEQMLSPVFHLLI